MSSSLQNAQKSWFNDYSNKIKSGTNNVNELKRYNDYAHYLKLQKVNPGTDTLRNMSVKALNGDVTAQSYLKAMNQKQLSGSALWNGYNPNSLEKHSGAYRQYIMDNPLSDVARSSDTDMYNHYNNMIQNGKAMKQSELDWYNQNLTKWNLDDMRNPFIQQQSQLEKDKQSALSAQDVALNNGMAQMDANSFNQMNQLQQQMSQRGMQDSGISADAYMRAQMGNNMNYQKAFAESAQTKSDIQSKYNEAISSSKIGDYEMKVEQDKINAENAIKLQEVQSDQDKWITEATGMLHVNGQRIMENGRPITTVEWEKMSEERRHNIMNETLEGTKIGNDYTLGMDSNDIKRQGIAVDLQIALARNTLDYAKLDYNYAKLEANNMIAQDKIALAAENAQTAADKSKITALGQQLNSLTKRIVEYQKKGDKVPPELVSEYNNVNGQLQALAGNFQVGTGGGM
jgi:hypothetical protein